MKCVPDSNILLTYISCAYKKIIVISWSLVLIKWRKIILLKFPPKYLIKKSKKTTLEKGFHQRHQLKRWRGISKEYTEMKPDDKKKESDNKRKEKNLLTMNLKWRIYVIEWYCWLHWRLNIEGQSKCDEEFRMTKFSASWKAILRKQQRGRLAGLSRPTTKAMFNIIVFTCLRI